MLIIPFQALAIEHCEDVSAPNKVQLSEDDYFISVLRVNNRPIAESIDVYAYQDTYLIPVSELGSHFGLDWQYQVLKKIFKSDYQSPISEGYCQFSIQLSEASNLSPYSWAEDDYGTYIDVKLIAKLLLGQTEFNAELQQINFYSKDENLGLKNQANARQAFFNEVEIKDYPIVRSVYQQFTSPIVNYNINGNINELGKTNARLASNIYSDIFGMSGEYRVNYTKQSTQQFLKLSRNILSDDAQAISKGNIKTLEDRASKYEAGDISLLGNELLFSSKQGLGINAFSYSQNQRSNFSTIRIEETALPGWRALLFRNGEFLAEQEVNENNLIVFDDVSTFYDVNNFSIILYGPEGERQTRTKVIRVGNRQQEAGTFDYQFSALDASQSLINGSRESNDFDKRISALARYGINRRLTVSAESHLSKSENDEDIHFVSSAIDYSYLNSLFRVKMAKNVDAGEALFVGINTSLPAGFNANVNLRQINGLDSEIYNQDTGLIQDISARLNGRITWPIKTSVNISASQQTFTDGEEQRFFNLQQSQNLAFGTYSNSFQYSNRQGQSKLDHRLFYSTFIGNWQLRQSLSWQPLDSLQIERYTASLRWPMQKGVNNETSLSYSSSTKDIISLKHQVNWRADRFNFQLGSSVDNLGKWSIRLSVSGSLYLNQDKSIALSSPIGNKSRRIRTLAFIDQNHDGILNNDEETVSDIQYLGRPNWKGKTSDTQGHVELFTQNDYQSISIDEGSLNDPFLSASESTKIVNIHAGGQAEVRFALSPVNDIEGSVSFAFENANKGVFGLTLRLSSSTTGRQYDATSEGDGYFFFAHIPPGSYMLSIDKEQLAELGFKPFKEIEIIAPDLGDIVTLDEIVLDVLEESD